MLKCIVFRKIENEEQNFIGKLINMFVSNNR